MILSYRFACRRTDSDGPPTFFHRTAPLSKFGNIIIPQCLIGSWMAGPPLPRQHPVPWVMGFARSASMS